MSESLARGEPSSEEQLNEEKENSFEKKKIEYFKKISLSVREAFKMHKEAGLWGEKNSEEDWRDVSEHCLVEAARAQVFADKLGLSEDVKRDLVSAAALHDFFKKEEIKIYETKGISWDNYEKAEERASNLLREGGFNERVIKLVGSIGMIALGEVKGILGKKELSQDDIAFLVLHYIDDYTNGSEWAEPSKTGEDGKKVCGLDERLNAAAKKYWPLGEQGGERLFNGESSFSVEIKTGHLVEKRITDILNERHNVNIIPEDLPYFIDQKIKNEIESEN